MDGFFSGAGQRAGMAWALHPAQWPGMSAVGRPFCRVVKGNTKQLCSPPEVGKQAWDTGKGDKPLPESRHPLPTHHHNLKEQKWVPGPSSILVYEAARQLTALLWGHRHLVMLPPLGRALEKGNRSHLRKPPPPPLLTGRPSSCPSGS